MRLRRRPLLIAALAALLAPATQAATLNIAVSSNSFSPKFPTINVGDTVIWTNMNGSHNVQADDDSFSSGPVMGGGWTFERTFSSPGSIGYHCDAHGGAGSGMFGTITVSGGGGVPGVLSFTVSGKSVGEGAGSISLTVQRVGGDDGAVSVQYETVNNGSADTPDDYIQTNGTLNWADNDDNTKSFNVPIVNDSEVEGNETFSVQLISPGGGATLGSPSVVTVTINDNDSIPGSPGTIQFTSSTANVGEGDATVSLTGQRVGGTNGSVSVSYATADGSALAGGDYVAANGTLSWGNGDSANKSFVVPIVGDTIEESTETFTATLSAPTGGAVLGTPTTTTVTITDDDITCDPCVADATTLCLAGGSGDPARFRVRVTWTTDTGATGPGMAVSYTPDSGFFWFFNADNLEYLAKMVNGCGSFADAYWFYYAAATNLALETEVLDTTACVPKRYSNPYGTFASDGDIGALPTCAIAAAEPAAGSTEALSRIEATATVRELAARVDRMVSEETKRPVAAEMAESNVASELLPSTLFGEGGACDPCVADATTLCLAGGSGDPARFRVRVTWTTDTGATGPGMAVSYTPDSGFFWFFNADNLEYLAKMVNGCGSFADAYWFYYAAATNLALETEVLDTTACVAKTYSNPYGVFASDGDIAALPTCATPSQAQP